MTSATYPTSAFHWNHDYSEGGDEVSLPYNGTTRAVLVEQEPETGGPWWLIDFTPGAGLSNPRQLTGALAPWTEQAFTFSSNPSTPHYAYVSNDNTIRRIDIRAMTEAPGAGWPITDSNVVWLHQSLNDGLFTWMRGANGGTVVGYEPASGTLKTYTDSNLNEPRIDRAGRYIGVTMNSPSNGLVLWDWVANTVTWTTDGTIPFAHVASLRDRWLGVDWNLSFPDQFSVFTPGANTVADIGGPANGTTIYGNGNWIQYPVDLGDQWALLSFYGGLQPTGSSWLAPGGMVFVTANGQRRLLGHPYNTSTTYNFYNFPKLSPDGRYVVFSSDMNGTTRSDVFLAEVPTSQSGAQGVVWTNPVNVTATGNSIQKTGGCDGCQDAGATSQQQIPPFGDGYVEFTAAETDLTRVAGLSNGNTDTSGADIDFAIALWNIGVAEVYEAGVYKATFGSYATGDVFRVQRAGGVVTYYKNGSLSYTSAGTSSNPLLVDTSLWGSNCSIQNTVISGGQ